MDNSIDRTTRFVKCYKKDIMLYVLEEYEIINGKRTLIRRQCPLYHNTEDRRGSCSGIDDHGRICGYADFHLLKDT